MRYDFTDFDFSRHLVQADDQNNESQMWSNTLSLVKLFEKEYIVLGKRKIHKFFISS